MKNIYKLTALLLLVLILPACSDDDEPMYEKGSYVKSAEFTDPDGGKEYILLEDIENNTFETYSWSSANYGISAAVRYTIQAALKGNNFEDVYTLGYTQDRQIRFSVKEMNIAMLELGVNESTPTYIELRIMSEAIGGDDGILLLPDFPVIYSQPLEALITPYVSDPPELYIAGNHDGWSHKHYIYSADRDSKYKGYIYLDGEFKFSSQPNWDGINYGAGEKEGELDIKGDAGNLKLPADVYFLTADVKALTWTHEAVKWGIVGDGLVEGSWDNDVSMTYDKEKEVYTATTKLKNGSIKFRQDGDWAVNLGHAKDDNTILVQNGDDIPVTGDGKQLYTITLDIFSDPTKYTCKIDLVK